MDYTIVSRETDTTLMDIVEALATATDTDPLSLSPPLQEVIDTDALECLLEGDALTALSFEYAGRTVAVDENGTITVDGGRPA